MLITESHYSSIEKLCSMRLPYLCSQTVPESENHIMFAFLLLYNSYMHTDNDVHKMEKSKLEPLNRPEK